MQLQEALLPGASSRAVAQHFPWAEPSCWQVSCPAGLQAGEGSACGGGQGLLLSLHGLTFQPTAGPYNLGFEEGERKGQGGSRQIFMAGLCAAGTGLDTLVLPAVVPVPPHCQVCAMCNQLSLSRCITQTQCRVRGQLRVFYPRCILPVGMVPHHWRGCTAPLR